MIFLAETRVLSIVAFISGVSLHALLYRYGDWDTKSPTLALSYLLMALIGKIGLYKFPSDQSSWKDLLMTDFWIIFAAHLSGVYGSMLIYRAFFHRLVKFPGPFPARLSNFYITWLAAKNLLVHEEIHSLHAKFGDYVRIGPRELSITDPAAVAAIYGARSETKKGPWYTLLDPRTAMSFTRDRAEHARRRKVWDQSFSTKALDAYEPLVIKCAKQLTEIIDQKLDTSIDMSKWVRYYAFEVMANLAFGKPFNMLTEQKESYFLKVIRQDMKLVGYLRHLPWLSTLFMRTPVVNWNNKRFWRWIEGQFSERIENGAQHPDIFGSVLDAYMQGPRSKSDTLKLHGDGYLIVIAGSDTTSSTITHLLFYLARDPVLSAKVQQKLDELPGFQDRNLMTIELLDALIFEVLRLHPATPAGLPRVTSESGLMIKDTHVPSDTIVTVPLYTIFRDERSFERPNEFIPERWTEHPELVKDHSVFIPFLIGPNACVGKRLAMMEIRHVVSEILRRYNISLDSKQTEESFIQGKVDTFTLSAAPLFLNFTKRGG